MTKTILIFSLLYSTTIFANYKNCTKEDMCLHTPCSSYVMEQIEGSVEKITCFQVFKKNKATGRHEMAYREVKVHSKTLDGKETGATIRLVDGHKENFIKK